MVACFAVEFNTDFLQINSVTKDKKVDVSRFEKGTLAEGKYISTIYLNDGKLNKEIWISLFLYDAPNWEPPEQRENSLNGVLLDFDTNYSRF